MWHSWILQSAYEKENFHHKFILHHSHPLVPNHKVNIVSFRSSSAYWWKWWSMPIERNRKQAPKEILFWSHCMLAQHQPSDGSEQMSHSHWCMSSLCCVISDKRTIELPHCASRREPHRAYTFRRTAGTSHDPVLDSTNRQGFTETLLNSAGLRFPPDHE